MIEPWWPLAALAAVQVVDAMWSWRPVRFVRDCLVAVRFPRRYWRVLSPVKLAAATGLVAGIWWQPLAVLTSAALLCYFLVACAMHVAARDLGRNLFLNAGGMLVLSAATLAFAIGAG